MCPYSEVRGQNYSNGETKREAAGQTITFLPRVSKEWDERSSCLDGLSNNLGQRVAGTLKETAG